VFLPFLWYSLNFQGTIKEDVKKLGTFFYKTKVKGNGLLVLSQGYEKGWIAFRISDFGFRILKKHVKVNSWANGWFISTNHSSPATDHQTIIIVFWPQLLEYLGFGILITSLVFILKKP
jgi:hypothetical protein